MATNPQSVDPAQAALAAIEDALMLPAEQVEAKPIVEPAAEAVERPALRMPEATPLEVAADKAPPVVATSAPKPRVAATPANDDRPSVGQIIQALQYRPSRAPLTIAALASVVWLALIGYYAWTQNAGAPLPPAQLAMIALAALGPAVFFFITGALARRIQEMRGAARAMTEVAARLADPETFVADQVVTL